MELKEIRFNESNIQLKDNLVKGSILPEKVAELTRTITIQGNTLIEGPVYAHKLENTPPHTTEFSKITSSA